MFGVPTDDRARRGQMAAIGFVLMFSIVVLLLVTLQVMAVPTWNQSVEFDHNERVRGDLEQYRDGLFATAASGRLTSESIELGTRYPTRPFLLNPTDPSGTIRTTTPGTVTISGANATGDTGDYWNGTRRAFSTRHLVYSPNYNEYATAPETVFENTVLYDRHEGRSLPITPERLIRGNDITIVTLDGSLDRGSSGTYDLEAVPLSASEEVTTVRSASGIELTVPTRLSESEWEALLEDELDGNGGRVESLNVTDGDPYDALTLTLSNGTYDLRMAKIGVGSGYDRPDAHYITTESPSELQVASGETERLVFTVRDRYNNPVSGVEVNATPSETGNVTPVSAVTDSEGTAVFRYEGATSGEETVTASFGPDSPEADLDGLRTANVTIETRSAADQRLGVEWIGPSSGEDDRYTFDVGATGGNETTLRLASEPAVSGLNVSYYVTNTSVGTIERPTGTTGPDGRDEVTFTALANGTTAVYAVGGGDADVMEITVTDLTAHTEPSASAVVIQRAQPARGNNINTTVNVSAIDPNAQLRVEALNNGTVENSKTVDVEREPLQSVRVRGAVAKQGQITHIRVVVLDGDNNEQSSDIVPYPYPP